MTGLTAANQPEAEESITNDGFFPDIAPAECRDAIRLDDNITPERLRPALIDGMLYANQSLKAWAEPKIEAGNASLASTTDQEIDGKNVHETHYKTAVYCYAKAELLDQYRDYDTTNTGSERAEDKEQTADTYRRKAILALRDIKGTPRSTVELI